MNNQNNGWQQNYQQQNYQQQNQPPYGAPIYTQPIQEMSVGSWMLSIFLTGIPIVGLILLIVWSVSGSQEKRVRKNWAIAQLIWLIIGIVISVLITVVGGVSIPNLVSANY